MQTLETQKDLEVRRQEARVLQLAKHRGFSVEKSRERMLHSNNQGLYRLVDHYNNTIVDGVNFDATLDVIEGYLEERPTLRQQGR